MTVKVYHIEKQQRVGAFFQIAVVAAGIDENLRGGIQTKMSKYQISSLSEIFLGVEILKKIHTSETSLLITLVLAILLTANALLGYMLTRQSQASMKELLQTRMLDAANTAADLLDGDKLKSLKAEDKGTPDYQNISDTLAMFRDNIGLAYIYCIQAKGEKEFVFSVDPTLTDPGEFGSPIVYTEALYKASLGKAAADDEAYEDAWGRFYSAYSPVFDSDGRVAGIVAVDFSAKWYDDQIAKQTHTMYICIAVSMIVCVLLVFLATSRARRRVEDMTKDLADLTNDIDEITWELSNMGASEEFRHSLQDKSTNLGTLNQRIRLLKDGLHSYWEDSGVKANLIVTALSSDYRNVYYLNLDKGRGVCHKALGRDCGLRPGQEFPFMEVMEMYAHTFVAEEDQEAFVRFLQPEAIRQALKKDHLITRVFKIHRKNLERCMAVRIAAINHPDNRVGFGISVVGVGFYDVDEETCRTLSQRQERHQ